MTRQAAAHRNRRVLLGDATHVHRSVAARVLRNTLTPVALRRSDDRTRVLRDTISEPLTMDDPRKRLGAMMSGPHLLAAAAIPGY